MKKDYSNDQANLSGIYVILNLVTGDAYIGQTLTPFRVRYNRHKGDLRLGRHGNQRLQRAWVKYGPDAFSFKVLEVVMDKAECERREQFWMEHYRGQGAVYNFGEFAASPRFGQKNTPEHTAKTAKANKGQKRTAASRKQMSDAQKARFKESGHPRLGVQHTAESIEKMRQAHSGRKAPKATREKMSKAHKGHEVTEQTRAAISAGQKGNANNAKPFPPLLNIETGLVVEGVNLAGFCRENGLVLQCMQLVVARKQSKHRGWKLA